MEERLSTTAYTLAQKGGWNGCSKRRKRLTNAYLIQGSNVLLGYKKRGFGEGKVNGFGGKVDEASGETVNQAALREMEEESGVRLLDAVCVGVLLYDYPTKETSMEVYVYTATQYEGAILKETDEMIPQWVAKEDLNYSKMWADDPYWLDKLFNMNFKKNAFVGWFDFSDDMSKVTRCDVIDVELADLS